MGVVWLRNACDNIEEDKKKSNYIFPIDEKFSSHSISEMFTSN